MADTLDAAGIGLHPHGGVADGEGLALVARVWGTRKSGVIRSDHVDGRALLIQGEPRDLESLEFLVRAVYVGGLRFTDGDAFSRRPDPTLAAHLWHAAATLRGADIGPEALDSTLVDGPAIQGVGLFPLTPATRKLLAIRHDPRDSLADLLEHSTLRLKEVAEDLGALVTLGALRLRQGAGGGSRPRRSSWSLKKDSGVEKAVPPRRRPASGQKQKAKVARRAATPSRQKIGTLRARLERELDVVRAADDWTVVGANARMPSEAIERACERMTSRYAKLMDDDRLPGDVRDLAQEVHARVLLAVGRIQDGKASSGGSAVVGDLLEEGKRLFAEGRTELALKCFAKARQDTGSPVAQAWLGWSIYNDSTRPEGDRRRKGRDLVEMAVSSSDFLPDPLYLMARIEYLEGDLLRSWNWLEKLMKLDPEHVEGRALLFDVRTQINKDR